MGWLQKNKMHKGRNSVRIRGLSVAESEEEKIEKTKQKMETV